MRFSEFHVSGNAIYKCILLMFIILYTLAVKETAYLSTLKKNKGFIEYHGVYTALAVITMKKSIDLVIRFDMLII